MKEDDKSKLIEVFNGAPWEAELVKAQLASNGIDSMAKDSLIADVILPPTAIDVAILVREEDYEAAMEVIREREKNKDGD
ncbi:DUF2007-related protein [Bacteroides helcogenes]|uniref:DUF2007 domain-containing protein n=1 Tax=Bacteroides helcogenes (strain ATCC 35417 / DSM 20613 / JCM 6297 / CCUG 15421 / P 36-108) TaxID=693979 RepID=E6SUD8_BACT6|nr:DUF2007-related protein [Bacteroides helcogenes]ADV42356.1 hypothetical protein Bache_0327 [Bacteroides helcogenes P 36-108]MDY5237188.1 DUF2007-related protein [Bacteroides helcogenes]